MADGGRERGLTTYGPSTPDRKAPTTAFWVGADSAIAERRMREQGVIPSSRGSVIRLAPHFYSTVDDVDRALDALAAVVHGRGGRSGE
jgi:selenocysteine lyase/cysteine desulfurase